MDSLTQRGVRSRAGSGPTIGCPVRGCDGVMYRVQDGELLQRSPRPGWTRATRDCRCGVCDHAQSFTVLVRANR